ncbi:hypothetical protein AMJ47_03115 [Parcubacteria bacterium DG_72]|nr:MAG: hypothetical protein AMJ47_03115 [Parcubacteria bacterium DG_72]
MNKLLIPLVLLIAGILIAGAIFYTSYSKSQSDILEGQVSAEEAGNIVMDFINNNLLKGQAQQASLLGAAEENGLYKISFEVEGQQVEWRASRDGRFIFPQIIDLEEVEEPIEEAAATIGRFSVSSDDVCLEDGKPIIYFFGSESCPYCQWEHPIMEQVMARFEGFISFHNNMDTGEDMEVFDKYSTGGIPATVFGCQYYRVGSGETLGAEENARALTALTCKLTDNQPEDVCSEIQDLIDRI